MKFFRNQLLKIGVVTGLTLCSIFMFGARASAADAACFYSSKNHIFSKVNCGDYTKNLEIGGATSISADTCYYIDQPPFLAPGELLPKVNLKATVKVVPSSSKECQDWSNLAAGIQTIEPKCYVVAGTIEDYDKGTVTSNKVTSGFCNAALVPGVSPDYFQHGACYLVFAGGTTKMKDCKIITDHIGRADAKQSMGVADATSTQVEADCGPGKIQECIVNNPLIIDINLAINLLSSLVGIIVVIMMILGGIQYMTAGGNPQAVAVAKKRISNAALSIVALIFMYSFLQWIIPGGIF